ncbi:hypothetical protein [Desulfobacter postgatei]|jgi:hypothetical protein|uniref:Uncharacterized protein n=1 Tax=Desulfobacter postgatei 2ac9 TaxID=879212 RepID=I5B2H0_9BACT|nr:hypothetical protein [Desulfobacter postgatei]EIM63683.1 hypothetical protein DespoDRAFT_01767 [Desulfobacter postgatei 2ac9]
MKVRVTVGKTLGPSVAAVPGSTTGGTCVPLTATTGTMLISTTTTACVLPEFLFQPDGKKRTRQHPGTGDIAFVQNPRLSGV